MLRAAAGTAAAPFFLADKEIKTMSRILMLGLAIATGTALLTGAGEAAAQVAPANAVARAATSFCAAFVFSNAPLRAAPDDAAPQVGTAPGGTWMWVDSPPVNGYYRVEPPIDRPPMPGTDSWIRENYIRISSCQA